MNVVFKAGGNIQKEFEKSGSSGVVGKGVKLVGQLEVDFDDSNNPRGEILEYHDDEGLKSVIVWLY